jgi:hypothetical protein
MLGLAGLFMAAQAATAADRDTTVIVEDFKYPQYNKDGQVEFILHGSRARKAGIQTNIEEARLEWVEELPGSGTGTAADRKFRVVGTVTTPTALYDESTNIITGEQEIHYRSTGMDADGVGFDANQKLQTLHVRSKVKVLLRENLRTGDERKQDAATLAVDVGADPLPVKGNEE